MSARRPIGLFPWICALAAILPASRAALADDVPDPVQYPFANYVRHIDDPSGTDPDQWLPEANITWYGTATKIVDSQDQADALHILMFDVRNPSANAVLFKVRFTYKEKGASYWFTTSSQTVTLQPGDKKVTGFAYDERLIFGGDDTGNLRVTVRMKSVPDVVEWGIAVVEDPPLCGAGLQGGGGPAPGCTAPSLVAAAAFTNEPGEILVQVDDADDPAFREAPALSLPGVLVVSATLLMAGRSSIRARRVSRRGC